MFAMSSLACVPDGKGELEADQNGKVCSAYLSVAGTFAESRAADPLEVKGCWPVGTWTFKATLEQNECAEPPTLEEEYAFLVERDEDGKETYQYLTDPNWERVYIKVTSGGGGLCEGGLEVFSEDGTKVLNLKPALQADATLTGFGEYDIFKVDRW
jgi:hypothetical protein